LDDEAARRVADEVTARAVANEAARVPGIPTGGIPRASGSRLRALLGKVEQWFFQPAGPAAPKGPAGETPTASGPGSNFEAARRFVDALSSTASPEEMRSFFSEDATQEEFPHRFLEMLLTRGLPGILDARARALARFKSQRYDLTGATGGGSQVAMEVRFQGVVASTGDGFTEGQELEARLAILLKFADGKIVRQRTYACFEPWSTPAERRTILDERLALAGQFALSPAKGLLPAPPGGTNFDRARSYLDALNARAEADVVASFFAPEAVHEELPNRLNPQGVYRNLEAIKRSRARSLASISSEHYELMGATGGGSQVALEIAWTGIEGVASGAIEAEHRREARLAVFLTFRDGLIVRQRNYACPQA
jgi:ketosteroid isomerase-like protein